LWEKQLEVTWQLLRALPRRAVPNVWSAQNPRSKSPDAYPSEAGALLERWRRTIHHCVARKLRQSPDVCVGPPAQAGEVRFAVRRQGSAAASARRFRPIDQPRRALASDLGYLVTRRPFSERRPLMQDELPVSVLAPIHRRD
jgi:hypothetical protein